MRVRLVGTPDERRRLRKVLVSAAIEISGEFDTLSEAARADDGELAVIVGTADRQRRESAPPLVEPLTPRELEVLQVLGEGQSNKGIAERLGISDQTVKFHIAAICGKLGAINRTEAVRFAIQRGLIAI